MRTDIHRPSALKPEDYVVIGWSYCGPHIDEVIPAQIERAQLAKLMEENGYKWSQHEHGGTCHICGAHAHYLVVWLHKPTGTVIASGEDCAAKVALQDAGMFTKIRTEIYEILKYKTGVKKARAMLFTSYGFTEPEADQIMAWYDGMKDRHPERSLIEVILGRPVTDAEWKSEDAVQQLRLVCGNQIEDYNYKRLLWKVWNKMQTNICNLIHYGSWFDGTAEWTRELWTEIQTLPQKIEAMKQAKIAKEVEAAKHPVLEGRLTIAGTVISVKDADPNDMYPAMKMLVEDTRGWRVWGSVPSNLTVQKGDKITFVATVTKSYKDPSFGFFKRPSNATTE